MDGAVSIRQLMGRNVRLVQAEHQVEGVVSGIAVRLEEIDSEEAELEVDGDNGTTYVIYLTPQDWCEGVCAPAPEGLTDGRVGVEWRQTGESAVSPSLRRLRRSPLAE